MESKVIQFLCKHTVKLMGASMAVSMLALALGA